MFAGLRLQQPIRKQGLIFNGQTIDGGQHWELPYPIEFTQGYDSYLKARQTGVPYRDHSLKHGAERYVRMIDEGKPFPERTVLSEPANIFGPAPEKPFAKRYSEIRFNGVLKLGRTRTFSSSTMGEQRTFVVSYLGMKHPFYVHAETEAEAQEAFNTLFPDSKLTDIREETIVTLTVKGRTVRKRGSITVDNGKLRGQHFAERIGEFRTSLWIQQEVTKQKGKPKLRALTEDEQAAGEKWLAEKAKEAATEKSAVARLRCVFCLTNEIAREEFLLCTECAAVTHAVDVPYFNAYSVWLEQDNGCDGRGPEQGNKDFEKQFSQCVYDGKDQRFSDQLPKPWNRRPLGEWELAVILATKFKGFTYTLNPAKKKKAQHAAAMLVGHFVYGHTFAEVAAIVPRKSAEQVRDFCGEARRDYAKKFIKQVLSDNDLKWEVEHIIHTGLLRNLYPAYAMNGRMVQEPTNA
jgi:hypothetical protein